MNGKRNTAPVRQDRGGFACELFYPSTELVASSSYWRV